MEDDNIKGKWKEYNFFVFWFISTKCYFSTKVKINKHAFFIHSVIQSFNKFLLNAYYMWDTVPSIIK